MDLLEEDDLNYYRQGPPPPTYEASIHESEAGDPLDLERRLNQNMDIKYAIPGNGNGSGSNVSRSGSMGPGFVNDGQRRRWVSGTGTSGGSNNRGGGMSRGDRSVYGDSESFDAQYLKIRPQPTRYRARSAEPLYHHPPPSPSPSPLPSSNTSNPSIQTQQPSTVSLFPSLPRLRQRQPSAPTQQQILQPVSEMSEPINLHYGIRHGGVRPRNMLTHVGESVTSFGSGSFGDGYGYTGGGDFDPRRRGHGYGLGGWGSSDVLSVNGGYGPRRIGRRERPHHRETSALSYVSNVSGRYADTNMNEYEDDGDVEVDVDDNDFVYENGVGRIVGEPVEDVGVGEGGQGGGAGEGGDAKEMVRVGRGSVIENYAKILMETGRKTPKDEGTLERLKKGDRDVAEVVKLQSDLCLQEGGEGQHGAGGGEKGEKKQWDGWATLKRLVTKLKPRGKGQGEGGEKGDNGLVRANTSSNIFKRMGTLGKKKDGSLPADGSHVTLHEGVSQEHGLNNAAAPTDAVSTPNMNVGAVMVTSPDGQVVPEKWYNKAFKVLARPLTKKRESNRLATSADTLNNGSSRDIADIVAMSSQNVEADEAGWRPPPPVAPPYQLRASVTGEMIVPSSSSKDLTDGLNIASNNTDGVEYSNWSSEPVRPPPPQQLLATQSGEMVLPGTQQAESDKTGFQYPKLSGNSSTVFNGEQQQHMGSLRDSTSSYNGGNGTNPLKSWTLAHANLVERGVNAGPNRGFLLRVDLVSGRSVVLEFDGEVEFGGWKIALRELIKRATVVAKGRKEMRVRY
ncbi:hypothetical protein HDU76_002438 [Blyttiomyces sp. JEL0837]|nr:hypothetical protein HDU76_002438 [Blyttiomyces sp. JEL0837]